MNRKETVRIGGGSGAMVDSAISVPQLLAVPGMHYLIFDYLGEAAMAMLQKMRRADPASGFLREFLDVQIGPYLADIAARDVKLVTNAGAMNPRGLATAIEARVAELGLDLKVAYLEGDDLSDRAADFRAAGVRDMFNGKPFPEQVVSINAYFGAFPIAAALAAGADIIITGRVVDSALALGPLIHEFGWGRENYDRLAAGTVAGHLLECGAQATGGTFTDWRDVPDWSNIGFPYAECHADGSFIISKPEGSGGLVSIGTISEQMLYEVGDPQAYHVPDVVVDFSDIALEQVGPDRVRVTGARGYPPTSSYKVCVTFDDGWRSVALTPIIGLDAVEKAHRQADAILKRTSEMLRARNMPAWRQTQVDILGTEGSYGPRARPIATREAVLRILVDHDDPRAGNLFWREQNSAIMNMAVGTSIGLANALPQSLPLSGMFSFLIDKADVRPVLTVDGRSVAVEEATDGGFAPDMIRRHQSPTPAPELPDEPVTVPLIDLAWARSGEKGDLFNVAVIARDPEWLPFIRAALTPAAVGDWYRHFLEDPEKPQVELYEVPGFHALNFVVQESQTGGINMSTRLDSACKAMAQHLLEFPVPVPSAIGDRLSPRVSAETV